MVSWLRRRRAGRRQLFYGFVAASPVAVVVAQLPEACRALPQVCRGDGVLPVGPRQIIATIGQACRLGRASRFGHDGVVSISDAAVRSLMLQISCGSPKTDAIDDAIFLG